MKYFMLMLSLWAMIALPAFAQGDTGTSNASGVSLTGSAPIEVGTTRIAPGVYTITDMATGKTSQLTVTDLGKMILQSVPVTTAPASGVPLAGAPAAAGQATNPLTD